MDEDVGAIREALFEAALDFDADDVADKVGVSLLGLRLPGDDEPWFAEFWPGAPGDDWESKCTLHRGRAGLDRLATHHREKTSARTLDVEIADAQDVAPEDLAKARAAGFDVEDAELVPLFAAGNGSGTFRDLTNAEQSLFAVALAVMNDAVVEALLPPATCPDPGARPMLVVHDDGTHLTHELTWERFEGDDVRLLADRAETARLEEVLAGRVEIAAGDSDAWLLAEDASQELVLLRLIAERQPDAESFRTYFGVRREDVHEDVLANAERAFQDWLLLRPNRSGDRASPLDRILKAGDVPPPQTRVLSAIRDTPIALYRVAEADFDPPRIEVVDLATDIRTSVTSETGTVPVEKDDVVAARLLTLGECFLLNAASPPLRDEDLPGAREMLARFGGEWTAASINAKPHLLGRLWWWLYTPAEPEDDEPAE